DGSSNDSVIAGNMRMNNVKFFALNNRAQPKSGEQVRRIEERERNIRIERAFTAPRHGYGMSAAAQCFDEFKDMRLAAAEVSRGVNLQDSHSSVPPAAREFCGIVDIETGYQFGTGQGCCSQLAHDDARSMVRNDRRLFHASAAGVS